MTRTVRLGGLVVSLIAYAALLSVAIVGLRYLAVASGGPPDLSGVMAGASLLSLSGYASVAAMASWVEFRYHWTHEDDRTRASDWPRGAFHASRRWRRVGNYCVFGFFLFVGLSAVAWHLRW